MKKFTRLFTGLFLVLSLALVGCGSSDQPKTDDTNKAEDKKQETTSGTVGEMNFNYFTQDQLKDSLEKNEEIILLDIQPEKDFKEHHIKGAIPTYAYPAKTDEDKAKLDPTLDKINASKAPVVIICPGGKSGAENTYNYLKEKGVDESRLFILKNGQKGWTYEELLEK